MHHVQVNSLKELHERLQLEGGTFGIHSASAHAGLAQHLFNKTQSKLNSTIATNNDCRKEYRIENCSCKRKVHMNSEAAHM